MIKVTCALIIKRNRILITRRNSVADNPLKWEFPGGKTDSGETNEECIVREIREELGIDIEIIEPLVALNHDYGFKKIYLIPFLCRIKSGEIKLTEHHAIEWVKCEQLEDYDFTAADIKIFSLPENQNILKKYLRENMNYSR